MAAAISPGSWIRVGTGPSAELCSVGFIAVERSTHRAAALTAGHCGEVGAKVFSRRGDRVYGTVIRSTAPSAAAAFADDIAVVRFDGPDAPRRVSNQVDGRPVLGYLTVVQANSLRPAVCKDGARTGVSCGSGAVDQPLVDGGLALHMLLQSDHGDSGCPVYATAPQGVWAIGVLGRGTGPTSSATMVEKYATQWGLDFVSPNLPPAAKAATSSLAG